MSQLATFQQWSESVLRLRVEELEQFNHAVQSAIQNITGQEREQLALLALRVNTHFDRMRRAKE